MQDAHVEPVQSLRSHRGSGRRRTLLAVGTPVFILLTIVAGGVLGQGPAPQTPRPTAVPSAAVAPDTAQVGPAFPEDAFGVPVWTVQETIRQIRAGRMSRGVVAVEGWLRLGAPSGACESTTYVYCRRETVLTGSPDGGSTGDDRADALRLPRATPALRTIALPGAELRALDGLTGAGGGTEHVEIAVPAVLIGSVIDDHLPECRSSGRRCEDSVALERVVWADDAWVDRRAVIEAEAVQATEAGAGKRHEWIRDVVPGAGETLSEVLVPIARLHALDPDVDAAVPGSVVGPVWYVRFLVHGFRPRAGEPHDVGWAVIHDASGTVVAADPGRTAGDVTGPDPAPADERSHWPVM